MNARNWICATALGILIAGGASAAPIKAPFDLDRSWDEAQTGVRSLKLPVQRVEYTPASRAYDEAAPAVFQVVAAYKTADIPDNELDPDLKKFSAAQKARMQALRELAKKNPLEAAKELVEFLKGPSIPRISRDYLPPYDSIGFGSGFFIRVADKTGMQHVLAVTNAHVAKMVAEYEAKHKREALLFIKSSQDPSPGRVGPDDLQVTIAAVGKNNRDIAFLNVPNKDWPVLPLADVSASNKTNPVKPTNVVYALGFPFGSNFTVTEGIVSADTSLANNSVRNPYVHLIQTSAAINPGNSGGPLARLVGDHFEVIGMNTLIFSKSGTSSGVGYAISSNDILKAAQQFLDKGNLDVGFIGMEMRPQRIGDSMFVVVAGAIPGSPAAFSGLQKGDIILGVDGERLSAEASYAMVQIQEKAKAKYPGDTIVLLIQRGDQVGTISIKIGKEPEEKAPAQDNEDDGDN